jgi:16S rRNA (cytosine967-C5)-methyltransferase
MNTAPSKARQAALYVLGRCRRDGAWSPQVLQPAVEKFGLDRRDAAFCTRLCRAVLQNTALCDFTIDCFSSVPSARLEPKVRDILRLGICQLLFMDRVPQSAAVGESVALVKYAGLERASGLVNAVLRRVAGAPGALPEIPGAGTPAYLSVRYSHPLWLCSRLAAERGYDFTEAFLAANNTEAPLCATVNTCKNTAPELIRILEEQGVSAKAHPTVPNCLLLHGTGDIAESPAYREGRFFIQDAGAALTVLAAGPAPGMRVLDGCAAPGGKSFLSGILMEGRGELLACDNREKKLSLLVGGAQRLGLPFIETRVMDAGAPDASLIDSFDLVLADVPCSGLGVLRKKPEIRQKDPKTLGGLPEVQLRILRGLGRCVRPGGVLLYSTCTVLREENEGVVASFLESAPEFSAEGFYLPGVGEVPDGTVTLWPQLHDTVGFFISRMRRKNA